MDTSRAGVYEYKISDLSDQEYDNDPNRKLLILQQHVNPRPNIRFANPGRTYKYCLADVFSDDVIPITLDGVPPFALTIEVKHSGSARPDVFSIPNIETNKFDFRVPQKALTLGHHTVSVREIKDGRGCVRKLPRDTPAVAVLVTDVPSITPLDPRTDYCVGDRIMFTLSGLPSYHVYYTFEGATLKVAVADSSFRRIAERPGNFTVTGVTDSASDCKVTTNITKIIHDMPSVKISQGGVSVVDIHEGGQASLDFQFWGTPPFEFT